PRPGPTTEDRQGVGWVHFQTALLGPHSSAVDNLADRRLDQVTVTYVLILQRQGTREAKLRSNTRGGRYAGESAVRAMRTFFRMAIADGLLPRGWNPAWEVKVPRRLPSTRRALRSKELLAINHVVVTTGRDVPLDSLLLRLHSETACRRSGALSLRLADLDTESCAVRLREKFGTERWQPISPTMVASLLEHAQSRGVRHPGDQLLRNANGTPLTRRRYDLMWKRVQARLPWAAKLGVSAHWMRHTTLTWVERHYSYAVARAYAGHTDTKGGSTLTYIKGMPQEVARALSAYTGEPHPLAELGRL
ncbi:tyrosine-type recombinase/integrase, partial [Saccharothrix carnea]